MSYSIEKPANVFIKNTPKDCFIVDVRTAAEVKAKSLPGAIHLPLQNLTVEALQQAINQQTVTPDKILLLCHSGRRAETAAKQLDGQVSQSLVVIEGGIQAVEKLNGDWVFTQGSSVWIERQVRIAAGVRRCNSGICCTFSLVCAVGVCRRRTHVFRDHR